MRKDIVKWLKKVCPELGLSANYNQTKDIFIIHKRGYAIQNFNTEQFYQIPKPTRRMVLLGILKRGLTHNIGERALKGTLNVRSQHGIRIV